jgi:RNA polymerase sigma factor (sigma-70 family)
LSPRIPIRLLAVQPDERLVRLVREGHERAFEALVHRYRRPLLRYCRRMCLSDSRAEDVLQLTLLNAWLALARGAEVRELRPWLYRIAHNAAVNAARGSSERNAELAGVLDGTADHAAGDELERRIAVCDALADVAALPPLQRRAILLTAVEGKTHDEVAGSLGVNQDAVRGLVYRARATLRGAAALLPQPLLSWASGGSGAAVSTGERLTEASAGGGGALAIGGSLLKGAAVAITAAGALAGAAQVVPLRGHHARSAQLQAHVAAVAQLAGTVAPVAAAETSRSAQPRSPSGAAGGAAGAGMRAAARRRHAHHRGTPESGRDLTGTHRAVTAPAEEAAPVRAEPHSTEETASPGHKMQGRSEDSAGSPEANERRPGHDAGHGGGSGNQPAPAPPTSSPQPEGGEATVPPNDGSAPSSPEPLPAAVTHQPQPPRSEH